MMQDCLKRFKLSAVTKEDETKPESTKMKRDRKQKRLMFVDINIANRKSVLFDTVASNLFILDKTMSKFGLLVSKSTKTKTVNFKDIPTMGVAEGVELQIGE